jgi:serine/threonine protein kinase
MRFESFELKVVIGKGKFGLVYTAQHAASEKYVAIKFISKGIIFETKGVQRIQQVWFCFIDLVNFLWVVLSYSLVLSLSRSLALSLCRKWISFRTFITLL